MSSDFNNLLHRKGEELYRSMPWREDTRPYYVFVSEVMLQQTQVSRVVPKFEAFIDAFPDEKALASASLADVLKHWQGLGYNRRAKFLHEAAKMIATDFNGVFPDNEEDLLKLPGVGKNTAGAILAYSFNQPAIYVETNIRTVYIHHFFEGRSDVDDKEIVQLLKETVDKGNPRRFYWALMDYGSWLKQRGVRNSASSKHYKKQPILKGSLREMRGMILHALTNENALEAYIDDMRFEKALFGLEKDGLITIENGKVELTK